MEATGRYGGLLTMWDSQQFTATESIRSRFFLIVFGRWGDGGDELAIMNVYAPLAPALKKKLWDDLSMLKTNRNARWIIMGDFNVKSLKGVWSNIAKALGAMEKMGLAATDVIRMTNDRWGSDFVEGEDLSVALLRIRLDRASHQIFDGEFSWSKVVPTKVSCFVWRAKQNRIPSLVALNKRGVTFKSVTCGECQNKEETADHLLITCPLVKEVWMAVTQWCGVSNSISDCTTVSEALVGDNIGDMNLAHLLLPLPPSPSNPQQQQLQHQQHNQIMLPVRQQPVLPAVHPNTQLPLLPALVHFLSSRLPSSRSFLHTKRYAMIHCLFDGIRRNSERLLGIITLPGKLRMLPPDDTCSHSS
ncbi:unnamed protein product [Lactuca virosa]|uniref:Reverse transcriptase zinc-binding domain-containing protein n=1 Tax=Lactuca virosa TaxID=75947 RepID=A0AAU9LVN6_9ASTR|nr:unnamed protein product [Lactuca virosa]